MSKLETIIFNLLIEKSLNEIERNIESIFDILNKKLLQYLELTPINNDVQIFIDPTLPVKSFEEFDLFNEGVFRNKEKSKEVIKILNDYKKFLPIILLREAYNCYIPEELRNNDLINYFIHCKVLIDLKVFSEITHWNQLISKKVVNLDFLTSELDRLNKFLMWGETKEKENPFKFFLRYIRNNIQIMLNTNRTKFYSKFFFDYSLKSQSYYLDEEIIDTLRILVSIFYNIKSYRALLDYKSYFKEFTEKNIIKTDLSLRKFTESMHWIKDVSEIAPSYQINWKSINLGVFLAFFNFNPKIKTSTVLKIIENFPFFIAPKISKSSFGIEIHGFFIIPNSYIEDLEKLLKKLNDFGYLTSYNFLDITKFRYFYNLNYFRKIYQNNLLLDPLHANYKKDLEIQFDMDYSEGKALSSFSLLDWLIIDRIRHYSIVGFGFERREDVLKILKNDLINEILSQKDLINNLKKNLNFLAKDKTDLKRNFIDFINRNKSNGFFYIKETLSSYIKLLKLLQEFISQNPSITNKYQLYEHIKHLGISKSIEENILFDKQKIKGTDIPNVISTFFKSIKKYQNLIENYQYYYEILNLCSALKIFNLDSIKRLIEEENLVEKVYSSKEYKLNRFYEKTKTYNITNKLIERRLDEFINSLLIKPLLLNTLPTYYPTYFISLILENTQAIHKQIDALKFIFPHLTSTITKTNNNEDFRVCVFIMIPNLNSNEKLQLSSIFNNTFGKTLITMRRYPWSGSMEAFTRKDFYDLESKKFFYTKDLFNQFFLYIKKVVDVEIEPLIEYSNKVFINLWSKGSNINDMIKNVQRRIKTQNLTFNIKELRKLSNFALNLKVNLLDKSKYIEDHNEFFFDNFIKRIIFLPLFQKFGLSQYYLYFYPSNLIQIDFKLLLGSNFQSIRYPAQITASNSFLINYVYPYRDPGLVSYLNWLTHSKKIIREYCLFHIKKIYQNFYFEYNISKDGWDYDPNRFKIYFQKVLFDPNYNVEIQGINEKNIGNLPISEYKGKYSEEYQELIQIYNSTPLDIKSVWATIPLKRAECINDLLEKDFISPKLFLKNLNLIEEICIILPNVKNEFNDKLIKIFSFFNIAFIYEIEGEFYIHGFSDIIKFENGFMIVLHLPDCQLDEFEKLFDLIFEYMEIDHYVILNDLVNGKPLINSIYGNLKFLEEYNPLTNLIWSNKDKRWFNHKLFDQNFKPQYPDLFFGKPGLCKRCGVSLEKGKLCAECLYQLANLKDVAENELRKIIQSEEQVIYLQVLKEVRILIEKDHESEDIIKKVNDLINVKVGE